MGQQSRKRRERHQARLTGVFEPTLVYDLMADLGRYAATEMLALTKSPPDASLSAEDVFLLWATCVQHWIPSVPRTVHWSQELRSANLTSDLLAGVQRIEAVAQSGGDLNPFQTDLLENRNRPKKKKVEGARHRDGMLLDWGITHMHLGRPNPNDYFVGRGKELLFTMVKPGALYLLTVEDHNSFERVEVLEIVHRNWPEVIAPYRAPRGVVGLEDSYQGGPSPQELRQMRRSMIVPVQMPDGTIYFAPGGGVSTKGGSGLAINKAMALLQEIRLIEGAIKKSHRRLIRYMAAKFGLRPGFKLVYDYELQKLLEESSRSVIPWEAIGLKIRAAVSTPQ